METFVAACERGLKAQTEDEQAVHEREVRTAPEGVRGSRVGIFLAMNAIPPRPEIRRPLQGSRPPPHARSP
jgi:hypothetical protein